MTRKQSKAPNVCKLSVDMERGLRERIVATAKLSGLDVGDFVIETLTKEVQRRGLINEKALAATA